MRRAVLALGLLLLAAAPAPAEDPPLAWLVFDRYYDVEQTAEALRRVHAAYPDRTRLESMGKSREGRDLWVMTVFDPSAGDPAEKPAFYVDGNTHGNEVQCAEVCLFTIKYLLTKQDPWVKDLLKRVVFHVAPTVNPDSRHRFFHEPFTEHSPRGVLRPTDDDRDGQFDEDPADDLDGDGEILSMRVKDPEGDHVPDERDDRLLRPRKPGEKGLYRLLGSEGTDDDGDGAINEDGPGAVDPNRNWPTHWRTDDVQHGAGPFPLSEPETRATATWILAHPRIAGVQSYHNAGLMILRPSAAFEDKEIQMPRGDRRLYDEIARRGLQVLPTYRYLQIREDLYQVWGGFVEWTYVGLGIFSFTNELWGRLGQEVPGASEDGDLAALEWNDVALHGAGFVRWHEVPHPQHGTVEVGGWRRFTIRANPPDFLPETCLRNCLFTLEHAASVPALSAEAERAAGGAVRVRVRNAGLLPTIHEMARRFRTLPADRVSAEGARVVSAARERPGETPVPLDVKGGGALLPEGLPGETTTTLLLWCEGTPTRVVVESRLGGVVRAAVR